MDCKRLCLLVGATCIYIVLGTFLFSTLELKLEEENIDSLTHKLDVFIENHTCITASDLLYILDTIEAQSKQGTRLARHIISNTTRRNRWDYTGSLSYTVVLLTTIGYGHLAPDTTSSKIVSVFYALFGIPLTLVMLKEMGEKLNHVSKCLYKVKCFKRAWLNKLVGVLIVTSLGLTVVMILPSLMFVYVEDWTMTEALYYCFITLSTVGFGDFVPSGGILLETDYYKPYMVFIYIWILFGLVNVSLFITSLSNAMVKNAKLVEKHTLTKLEAEIRRMRLELSRHRRNTCSLVDVSDGKMPEATSHPTTLLSVHKFIPSVDCSDENTSIDVSNKIENTHVENNKCSSPVDGSDENISIIAVNDTDKVQTENQTCASPIEGIESDISIIEANDMSKVKTEKKIYA